ncbi:hypothetical protein BS47DRAFT_1369387 [Hydnum rufescens UP504]|uniref:Uncharacterized protein n=1 Tax=Hydnum rufescens UP504 TaxID=1448309 RepID=A0A9P6DM17_9AGAM|nr:hypothetical protein BS47DRAFT_1369387 [Hydnum rufescens UP504]
MPAAGVWIMGPALAPKNTANQLPEQPTSPNEQQGTEYATKKQERPLDDEHDTCRVPTHNRMHNRTGTRPTTNCHGTSPERRRHPQQILAKHPGKTRTGDDARTPMKPQMTHTLGLRWVVCYRLLFALNGAKDAQKGSTTEDRRDPRTSHKQTPSGRVGYFKISTDLPQGEQRFYLEPKHFKDPRDRQTPTQQGTATARRSDRK